LARGLRDDAGNEVGGEDGLHNVLIAEQFQHVHVLRVADLRDNVIRRGAASGIVGDRQRGFDDVVSGSSPSERMMMERACAGLRSQDRSCPWAAERQMMRVFFVSMRSRISSSISTLSLSAMTTMTAPFFAAFVRRHKSEMTP
jgi:hypothetical protein